MMLYALTLLSLTAAPAPAVADSACPVLLPNDVPVQGRQSPLDSLTFTLAKQTIKVCYGRPSARGRTMIGGKGVPYGKLWRTGANEPTVIFTPIALDIAGVKVATRQVLALHGAGGKRLGGDREPIHLPVGPRELVHQGSRGAGGRPGQGAGPEAEPAGRDLHHRAPSRDRAAAPHAQVGEDRGRRPDQAGELTAARRRRATRATPSSRRSTSSSVVYAAQPARISPLSSKPYRCTTVVA